MSVSVPQVHFDGNATNDGRVQLPLFGRIEMRRGSSLGLNGCGVTELGG